MYEALVARVRYHIQKANFMGLKEAESTLLLAEAADAIEELSKDLERSKEWEAFWEKEANEALKKFQTTVANMPRWIPVTERLPEAERKSYWVCTDTGYQCECRWTNNQFGIGESDQWDWSIFDIPQYQKVVAWMPLPCPYEPSKEE